MSADIFPFDSHDVVSTIRQRRRHAIAELLDRQTRFVEVDSEREQMAWTSGWLNCLEFLGQIDPSTATKLSQLCSEKRQQVRESCPETGSANKSSTDVIPVNQHSRACIGTVVEARGHRSGGIEALQTDERGSVRKGNRGSFASAEQLNPIARAIHHSLEETEVCQAIVRELCCTLEADCAGLIMYDLEAETLAVVAAYSRTETGEMGGRSRQEEAPLGLTLRLSGSREWNALLTQQRPWVARDLETAAMPEVERVLLLCSGLHSTLMVPLVYEDNPIGTVYISQHRSCRLWNSEEMKLAQIVAEQGAIALNHTRAYRNATKRAQREQVLNRIAGRIRTSLDLDTTINTALTELLNLTQVDLVVFSVPTPQSGTTLKITHRVCRDNRCPHNSEDFLDPGEQIALEEYDASLLQRLQGREVTVISNTQNPDELPEQSRAMFQQMQIGSLLSAPIWDRETLVGHVWAIEQQSYEWNGDEVAALETVALQLAIAITQAQLYNRTQQQAECARAQATQLKQTLDEKTALIAELQATQAQLVQSEKMSSLGQLVAGVAHEINNPINFIYGNIPHIANYSSNLLDLIERYQQQFVKLPQAIAHFQSQIDLDFIKIDLQKILQSMQTGSERVREIVLTLRNFSRLDEADLKWVNLHQGIDSTLILLGHRIHNLEVVKDYGEIPDVSCYSGQLNQVFMNLFSNAIYAIEQGDRIPEKASPDSEAGYLDGDLPAEARGRITITTQVVKKDARVQTTVRGDRSPISGDLGERTDSQFGSVTCLSERSPISLDWIQVRIRDTGCGIGANYQTKVFDPFFTTKPVGTGTGLGLAIAYKIVVEKHQGRLWFETPKEGGCEFIIELPVNHPPAT